MQYYQVNLLKDLNSPGPARLIGYLKDELIPGLEAGVTTFGIFQGLFGLASNEVYLVLSSEDPGFKIADRISNDSCRLIETTPLIPTVRPTEHSPRSQEGIYVFRWFEVINKNVAEIAELSEKAWVTFEGGFDTQVQALFAEQRLAEQGFKEADASSKGKMLLITWYRDLSIWQESRQPPAEARENFLRRHALTLEARPIATRLV